MVVERIIMLSYYISTLSPLTVLSADGQVRKPMNVGTHSLCPCLLVLFMILHGEVKVMIQCIGQACTRPRIRCFNKYL